MAGLGQGTHSLSSTATAESQEQPQRTVSELTGRVYSGKSFVFCQSSADDNMRLDLEKAEDQELVNDPTPSTLCCKADITKR